jgi:hypothetical protein
MAGVARAQQKALGFATTLCSLALIARLTLTAHGHGPLPSGFRWCVFCGTFGFADFLLNIALFIPLGWGLRVAGVRRWPIYLFGFLLAATIETLQDYVIAGRESGLNDLIANPLGAIVGVWLADHMRALVAPAAATSRRLALGIAAAWCLLAAIMPWLIEPSLPRAKYWEQVAARLPRLGKYHGQILSATYDGQPFRGGRLSDSASAAMRDSILHGRARVDVTTIPAPSSGGLVTPIVGVFDGEREEIFMVTCAGTDLEFGVRSHRDDLKLHAAAQELLRGAIACDDSDVHPGDTVRIHAAVDPTGLVLTAERAGRVVSARPDVGAWLAWRLLVPDMYSRQVGLSRSLTVCWLVLWTLPLGYWLVRAAWPLSILAGVALVALVEPLLVVPAVSGTPVAPALIWLVASAGLAGGFALAHRLRASLPA